MLSKIKNLIRLARITRSGDGDGQLPVQQVEFMGQVGDSIMVFPFGMHANVSEDALAVMFSIQGDAENRAAIGMSPNRPTLAAGEVALYHPDTGSIIKMGAGGDINITGVNVIINGVNFSTHAHAQANDSAGDTQVPTGPPL